MRRRTALLLFALLGVLLASFGPGVLSGTSADAAPKVPDTDADYVIIAGAAGLRWDDIDATRTPNLWRLSKHGAIASLSVRSAHLPTCAADGWVTLGAGNFAERTATPVQDACPKLDVKVETNAVGAFLPDQKDVVAHQHKLSFGAVPGALAEAVRCTAAVGPGAAAAAARPFGRIDRYTDVLPEKPAELLSACVLSIVDLGAVDAVTPKGRALQVAAVDALLGRVEAARPQRSTLLVAGVSDTDRISRLHVVIADGPGWSGGWLTSATTSRAGYLQLVDLAPTALGMLGRTQPKSFSGHAAVSAQGRPGDLPTAIAVGADADRQAAAARTVSGWFFGLLAAVQIILFAAVVPLLRRSYRHAGPTGPTPPPQRLVQVLEVLLTATALALPAALIADTVPWWRFSQRGLIFAGVTGGIIAVLTTVAVLLPVFRRRTLGPVGVVAAIATAVVGADLATGAELQLNGVAGYSSLAGGRYAGLGVVGMGVFIAGTLLTAACLAQLVPQRRRGERTSRQVGDVAARQVSRNTRPLVVAAVGALAVLLVGSPYLGADAGGAVALTVGVCLASALCTGGWLSFTRLAWATLIGGAGTAIFAIIDVNRSVEEQGSLGRFLSQWAAGTSSLTLHRTGAANLVALATSPLTVLALAAAVFLWSVLLRPWGGLKRLYGIYPPVRAAMAGIVLAALIAGALSGTALNVFGAAAATALPLLTLGAMRVLEHSADRTRIPAAVMDDTMVRVSST